MGKFMILKINNSKDVSVKSGKWKDPGAKLYDQLLNAAYFPSDNVDDPNNEGTLHYLKEAYLIAPVKDIKYGPYGHTPYSRSGCKYPHHIIRNGELVVHEGGLRAAYTRAKQQGIFSGEVKEHLERHYKELGIYEGSTMAMSETIENNFDSIEKYIGESLGIDLYSPTQLFEERFHDDLKHSCGINLYQEAIDSMNDIDKFLYEQNDPLSFQKDYIHEGKIADAMKYVGRKIVQFLRWLFGLGKRLKNIQMLSMPKIMFGPRIKLPIIGTPITIGLSANFKESNEYDPLENFHECCDDIFTEAIKDEKFFDSNKRMEYIGMFASDIKTAVLEFGKKYNVSVAIDTKGVTGEIAFAQKRKHFDEVWKNHLNSGIMKILYEDSKHDHIMCVSLKPFAWYQDPMTAKRLQWTIAHEYGHVLTLSSVSDEIFMSSIIKVGLFSACDQFGKVGHYIRNYYEIPVEKMANDAVGIVTDSDISYLSGCAESKFSGWKDSIFNKITKINIPSNIIAISKKSAKDYTEHDIVTAIQYSIETYPKFLPQQESSNIVNQLKSIKPSKIINAIKNQGGSKMESVDSDDLSWIEGYLMEEGENIPQETEEKKPAPQPEPKKEEPKPEPEKKESMPKKTDKAESDKNGVRRKKLYIAFIEWAKSINPKNTFGSIFDKDAFHSTYPFVPEDMRYFYRLANPMLCVLTGDLTFFAVAELKKLNIKNSRLSEMMIFAATKEDVRIFNKKDKKVYRGVEENGMLKLAEVLGETYDTYIQKMINQGDILNAPLGESVDTIPPATSTEGRMRIWN